MQDVELLQFVYKTAEMGAKSLDDLKPSVRDPRLREAVGRQTREYREISAAAASMLKSHGEKPKDPGLAAQLSAEFMTAARTLADSSASNIAQMVIQGNTMGVTKGTRHLNDYAGNDPKVRSLAEKLIQTEERNLNQMKKYL